jgi:hypothetical protein
METTWTTREALLIEREWSNQNSETSWNRLNDLCSMMRSKLWEIEDLSKSLTELIKMWAVITANQWECIAQSILAMRHVEDARMRFGKVIQYWSVEQKSIYDK